MGAQICVDASFILKALVPEAGTDEVLSLLSTWRSDGATLLAPTLIEYEVASALWKYVFRGLLTPEEGDRARILFTSLLLNLQSPGVLFSRAWELAEHLGQPTLYDTCYLALSERLVCPFWTADMKFINSVLAASIGYKVTSNPSGVICSLARC